MALSPWYLLSRCCFPITARTPNTRAWGSGTTAMDRKHRDVRSMIGYVKRKLKVTVRLVLMRNATGVVQRSMHNSIRLGRLRSLRMLGRLVRPVVESEPPRSIAVPQ